MGLLDGIEKLINEHGSATILKERIALANDKHAVLESENKILRTECDALQLDNCKLKEQVRALEEKFSHISSLSEFIEEAGALFKKNADGTYNQTPYCPSCKTAMASPGRHELFRCGKKSCSQLASFDRLHLGDVMARLP